MAKKLDKKSWIIIGTTFVLMSGLVIYSIYSMKKAEKEAMIEAEHIYASQSTIPTTTEGLETISTDEPVTTTSIISTDPNISAWIADAQQAEKDGLLESNEFDDPNFQKDHGLYDYRQDLVFNTIDDENMGNYLIDLDTISIDGHIIDLPSNYAIISQYFTFIEQISPDMIVDGTMILTSEATTGIGNIIFTFVSDEPTALKDCECRSIYLSSFNYSEDNFNMTISLINDIRFGDSYSTINDKMPIVHIEHEVSDTSWTNTFKKDNMYYSFIGENHGLVAIYIKYIPEN